MANAEPLVHWCPEEPDQAACDSDDNPVWTVLNSAKVSCPACLEIANPAGGDDG